MHTPWFTVCVFTGVSSVNSHPYSFHHHPRLAPESRSAPNQEHFCVLQLTFCRLSLSAAFKSWLGRCPPKAFSVLHPRGVPSNLSAWARGQGRGWEKCLLRRFLERSGGEKWATGPLSRTHGAVLNPCPGGPAEGAAGPRPPCLGPSLGARQPSCWP